MNVYHKWNRINRDQVINLTNIKLKYIKESTFNTILRIVVEMTSSLRERIVAGFAAAALAVPLLMTAANGAKAGDGNVETLDLRGRSNVFVALAMDKVASGKVALVVNGGSDDIFNFATSLAVYQEKNSSDETIVLRVDDNDNNPLQTRIEVYRGHDHIANVDVRPAADPKLAAIEIIKKMKTIPQKPLASAEDMGIHPG